MCKENVHKWSIVIIASLGGAALLLLLHEAVPWIRWLIVIAWYALAAMGISFTLTSTYPRKPIKLLGASNKTLMVMMIISTVLGLLMIHTLVAHVTLLERLVMSATWVCFMLVWAAWLLKIADPILLSVDVVEPGENMDESSLPRYIDVEGNCVRAVKIYRIKYASNRIIPCPESRCAPFQLKDRKFFEYFDPKPGGYYVIMDGQVGYMSEERFERVYNLKR